MARVVSSLVAGRNEEYLERAKDFTKASPDFVAGWRHIAAAYAILGRLDEARAAMEQVFKLSPDDCLESIRREVPIVHPDAKKKYLGALLDAGLPE
jgi:adenylate cyclase